MADANLNLEKERMVLTKSQERTERIKREELGGGRSDVYNALILFAFAIVGLFFNYLIRWQAAPSIVISLLLFGAFFALIEKRIAFTLLAIDIGALVVTEYLPVWGFVSVLILIRMSLWAGFALVNFVYRFFIARRKGILPTLLMMFLIFIVFFYFAEDLNRIYGARLLEHEEKYAGAFEIAERTKDKLVEETKESASDLARLGRALLVLTVYGDFAAYNQIMHPVEMDLEVDGKEDESVKEYVKVEFTKSEGFPAEIQQVSPQPIPVQLNAESPQKPITIDLSCRFKTAGKEYAGEIEPKQSYTVYGKEDPITVTCSSPYAFETSGQYSVIFEARIDNIETTSRLRRLFVGNERDSKRLEELRELHSLDKNEPSRGAEEFAAFAFGIGTLIENPILKNQEIQPISGNIINKADGFITNIKRISIELPDDIEVDSTGCKDFGVYGNELVFENAEKLRQIDLQKYGKTKKIHLLGCFLVIPEELRNTEDATERSFESVLEYSYKIEEKVLFKVMPSILT